MRRNMKKQLNYGELFYASYREAVALAKESGVSKRAYKSFVHSNTQFIYDDCKRNPKLRAYILNKYRRR